MHLVDHLFVLLLFVAQPIQGAIAFRRVVAKARAGEPADPVHLYMQTGAIEWSALFVLAVSWYLLERSPADLGFVAPGGAAFYGGIALLVIVCAFMIRAWLNIKSMTPEQKEKQAGSLGDLIYFLPQTVRQLRYFFGLSITAGVVEEIIYRGFVIWYLANFMPLWAALAVSSVFFGLAHSYQGKSGALRTGLVGFAFALLYVFTGSIWLPIIGHALFDILQGRMIFELLRDR